MTKKRLMDLTGQRYGKLTVVSLVSTKPRTRWLCRCDCGTVTEVYAGNLRLKDGRGTRSCGCEPKHNARALVDYWDRRRQEDIDNFLASHDPDEIDHDLPIPTHGRRRWP